MGELNLTEIIHCIYSKRDQLPYLKWYLSLKSLNPKIKISDACESAWDKSGYFVVLWTKNSIIDKTVKKTYKEILNTSKEKVRLDVLKAQPNIDVPVELFKKCVEMTEFFDKFSMTLIASVRDIWDVEQPSSVTETSLGISIGDLVLRRKIGEGCFGVAYLGDWNGKEVVVKRISTKGMTIEDVSSLINEVIVMERATGHPNIGILFKCKKISLKLNLI